MCWTSMGAKNGLTRGKPTGTWTLVSPLSTRNIFLHVFVTITRDCTAVLLLCPYYSYLIAVYRGPAIMRWCAIESNMTALLGEAVLLIPGYEYFSAIPQSRQAMLTALYRDTALLRPSYWRDRTVSPAVLITCYS